MVAITTCHSGYHQTFTALVSTWEVAECVKLPKKAGFLKVPRPPAVWVAAQGVILRTLQLLRPLVDTLGLLFQVSLLKTLHTIVKQWQTEKKRL